MSCGSCEHFNLYYIQTENPSTRGRWGDCMFPHKMNLDDVHEIKRLEGNGTLKRKQVWVNDSCGNYMPQHCYGDYY